MIEHLDYDYDKVGNRTRRTRVTPTGGETTTYAYNETNQLCWRHTAASTNTCGSPPAGATTFSYDAAGHQLTGDTTSAWDSFGRLSGVGGQAVTNLAPTNGELTGHGPTRFQNDLLGLARIDSIGSSDTTSIQRDPQTGRPVSQITNGEKRFYLQDHLGSTTALTTPSGTVARSYTYDPDGNTSSTGTGPEASLRFAAGHAIDGTGLYHFGARYYDPRTARWTQADPIQQLSSLTERPGYGYAAGDPINGADPSGCWSFKQLVGCVQGCALRHCDDPNALNSCDLPTGWKEVTQWLSCIGTGCGSGTKKFFGCVNRCFRDQWGGKFPFRYVPIIS